MKKLIVVIACLAYVLWPLDLLPDFIPLVGWIDDILAIAGTVMTCVGPTYPSAADGTRGE